MDFKLRTDARYFDDKELLKDIKRVARFLKKKDLSRVEYDEYGKFHSATIYRRFNGWNNALKQSGLKSRFEPNISNEELFDNLEIVWRTIGIQPSLAQMDNSPSKYSNITYRRRFGSWIKACKTFIKYKKGDPEFIKAINFEKVKSRTISEKKRLKILKRDNYKCIKCGRSPATHVNIALHIDHIKPFSKGGDSNIDNLQTLCNKCNLGKSNAENI